MEPDVLPSRQIDGHLIIVSSMASDSHTWNLVFLELLLEELGHRVINLGACVPDDVLLAECETLRPDLVVLSSVNGHGYQEGLRVIEALRGRPALSELPVVIGGKLGTAGPDAERSAELMAAGFAGVFEEGAASLLSLRSFINALPSAVTS